MIEIIESDVFAKWLLGLRDREARRAITARVQRLALGNPGDVKPVGHGISELRIRCGPDYRVYYIQRGSVLIVLLCGGDKSSQSADIEKAQAIARDLEV
ncbi:MAG: type II toxin-antitoxin system RelE/ParE family toxin [Terracidiphilus sp.]|jgi:putative addiction module killer protein